MITANLKVIEGSVSRAVRVRAASLARAMEIAGRGKPGLTVELVGHVAPTAVAAGNFSVPGELVVVEAA